jgi:hypothetical protein
LGGYFGVSGVQWHTWTRASGRCRREGAGEGRRAPPEAGGGGGGWGGKPPCRHAAQHTEQPRCPAGPPSRLTIAAWCGSGAPGTPVPMPRSAGSTSSVYWRAPKYVLYCPEQPYRMASTASDSSCQHGRKRSGRVGRAGASGVHSVQASLQARKACSMDVSLHGMRARGRRAGRPGTSSTPALSTHRERSPKALPSVAPALQGLQRVPVPLGRALHQRARCPTAAADAESGVGQELSLGGRLGIVQGGAVHDGAKKPEL